MRGVLSFPGKHDDENILTVIRKHKIVHWIAIVRFFVMAVIPTGLGFLLLFILRENMNQMALLTVSAFLLLYLAFFSELSLVRWLNEELNLIIITNLRAVNITQHGFLRRTIAETNLGQIQDVAGETCGICGNLLDYGDLSIRTASNYGDFFMKRVPSPHLKSRLILDFVDQHRNKDEASI